MSKRLFIGGLPYELTNSELQDMFASFGDVTNTNLIIDKYTGQSKGFGFVDMKDDTAADKAIEKLNNSEVNGRKIVVNVARPREERPNFEKRGNFQKGYKRSNRGKRY